MKIPVKAAFEKGSNSTLSSVQGGACFDFLNASYCLTIACAACWAPFLVAQKIRVGFELECLKIIFINL